jgi:hypothetical protein
MALDELYRATQLSFGEAATDAVKSRTERLGQSSEGLTEEFILFAAASGLDLATGFARGLPNVPTRDIDNLTAHLVTLDAAPLEFRPTGTPSRLVPTAMLEALRRKVTSAYDASIVAVDLGRSHQSLDEVQRVILRSTDLYNFSPTRKGNLFRVLESAPAEIETYSENIDNPFGLGGVLFFLDTQPLANWAHPCVYIFVKDMKTIAIEANMPPITTELVVIEKRP